MKNIPTFEQFVNESLNEGLASQGGKYLKEFDLQTIMDGNSDYGGMNVIYGAVATALSEDPKNIICVDGGDLYEPLQKSIYGELSRAFNGTEKVPVPNAPAGKYTTITYREFLDESLLIERFDREGYLLSGPKINRGPKSLNRYSTKWTFSSTKGTEYIIKNSIQIEKRGSDEVNFDRLGIPSKYCLLVSNSFETKGEKWNDTGDNEPLMILSTVITAIKSDIKTALSFDEFPTEESQKWRKELFDGMVLKFYPKAGNGERTSDIVSTDSTKRGRLYDAAIKQFATVKNRTITGYYYNYLLTDLKL